MPRRPTEPCAACGKLMWKHRTALPTGQATCLDCRRARNPKPVPAPTYWHCTICAVKVPRTSGPIGKYCKAHRHRPQSGRHLRQITCHTCGTKAIRTKGSKYCTVECQPKRERRAPRTNLQWKQCGHCHRWICKPGRKYCDKACAREAMMTQQGCRNRCCKQCGTSLGAISALTYCEQCRQQQDQLSRAANKRKRRVAKRNAAVETIHAIDIYERDGWKCGICTKPVSKTHKYPHPRSASLDHIEPISLGGTHTKTNVQLAHLDCNVRKGNREPAQLRLIG